MPSDKAAENPLLRPDFAIPFPVIRAEHVVPAIEELVRQAGEKMDAIIAANPQTFENTVLAMDRLTADLDEASGIVGHLAETMSTPELREAYAAIQPTLSAFASSVSLSEGLYRALLDASKTDWGKALTGVHRRFLDKTLDDFRRSGAELDPAGKKALAAIDADLAELTNVKFSENVLDATNAFELVIEDREKLAGLPESAIEAARASAEQKGKSGYRFTLQAPSYIAVMTYLDDREIREKVYRAFVTRASVPPHDNRENVRRILELRRKKARLLGFENFADLVLADRMAKGGNGARTFIEGLREKTRPFFERENAELEAYKQRRVPGSPEMAPWDVPYYAEKLRAEKYDFDEEGLKPYFAFDRVLTGLFEIAKRLYGVSIVPWEGASVWHDAVRPFKLLDEGGAWIASFYVDIFPRETKRDGAWMQGLFTGATLGARHPRHLGIVCANMTPPVGDKPALLTHREVETLFHEFGHLFHHSFSKVDLRSMSGHSVAWDFVELPSMIMENWCWEREALDLFARHIDTNAPIPEDLFRRMRAARSFRAANVMMRQLGFAEADLALHMDFDPEKDTDPVSFGRDVMAKVAPVKPLPETATIASFGHLFGSPVGYASGYYSYKWAEVLEADAFSRFSREGILDRGAGTAFRTELLSRGDSADPMDLFVAFLGRKPNPEAMFIRADLVAR